MIPTHPRIVSETCPNGLQVYLVLDPTTELVSVKTFVRAGAIHEGALLGSGLSHFLEHLVAGGVTSAGTEDDYRRLIAKLGGAFNAYTTTDHTCYYINTTNRYTHEAITALHEWMFLNTFGDKEFSREKEVITREIERDVANIPRKFYKLLQEHFFYIHPTRHPVIGYLENFQKVTIEQLKAYYFSRYTPANMALVVGGNIDPDATMAHIRATFGAIPFQAPPDQLYIEEPAPFGPREIAQKAPINATYLGVRFPSASLHSPDVFALDLLDYVLGNGENSILHQTIVEEKKLAYSISCNSATPTTGGGYFEITAKTDARHITSLKKAIIAIVDQLKQKPIPLKQLASAKKQKIAEDILDIETIEDKVDRVGQGYLYARNPDFYTYYLDKLHGIHPQDIQSVTTTYLDFDKATWVILSPEAAPKNTSSRPLQATPALRLPQKITLSNGLRILVYPDSSKPSVEVKLFALGGLMRERLDQNGIGYLRANSLGKSSLHYKKNKLRDLIDGNGADLTAGFGYHTQALGLDCLTTDFKRLWPVFVDTVLYPVFNTEDVADEHRKQLQKLGQRADDWQNYSGYHFRHSFFGSHPYGLSALGDKKTLLTLGAESLNDPTQNLWNPKEMVLTFFGDIDLDHCVSLAQAAFGSLSPLDATFVLPARNLHTKAHHQRHAITQDVTAHYVGFDGLAYNQDSLRAKMDVLNAVFSGIHYPSGRLHHGLREKGLVYMVYGSQFTGLAPGCFTVCALTSASQQLEVETFINTTIDQLQNTPITTDEFELALAQIDYHYKDRVSSWSSIASSAAMDELYGLGYDAYAKAASELTLLVKEDVQTMARSHFINPQTHVFSGKSNS